MKEKDENKYHMGQLVYIVSNYIVQSYEVEGMKYDDKEKIHVEYWLNGWWYPEYGVADTKEELIKKLSI